MAEDHLVVDVCLSRPRQNRHLERPRPYLILRPLENQNMRTRHEGVPRASKVVWSNLGCVGCATWPRIKIVLTVEMWLKEPGSTSPASPRRVVSLVSNGFPHSEGVSERPLTPPCNGELGGGPSQSQKFEGSAHGVDTASCLHGLCTVNILQSPKP